MISLINYHHIYIVLSDGIFFLLFIVSYWLHIMNNVLTCGTHRIQKLSFL